jgi:hypothetical protein
MYSGEVIAAHMKLAALILSRCTQIGSSALSVQAGGGKLDILDTLKR